MADKGPKSAYELAMEKLRARDREKGIEETKVIGKAQKDRIAEIRTQARAKLAEMEILWRSERRKFSGAPEDLEKAERRYVGERRKVEEKAEAEIEKIRRGA